VLFGLRKYLVIQFLLQRKVRFICSSHFLANQFLHAALSTHTHIHTHTINIYESCSCRRTQLMPSKIIKKILVLCVGVFQNCEDHEGINIRQGTGKTSFVLDVETICRLALGF